MKKTNDISNKNLNMINNRRRKLMFLIAFVFFATNTFAQSWNEVIKATASRPDGGNEFGRSVSIYGDWAIIGSPHDYLDENESHSKQNAGSAYIFKKDNQGNWIQTQKICSDSRYSLLYFGYSVSMSEKYLIVGAYGKNLNSPSGMQKKFSGAAYIFEKNAEGVWKETQRLIPSQIGYNYKFGYSVSISGEYAIIGGDKLSYGKAFIFERTAQGTWTEVQKLASENHEKYDKFGQSVCISGNYALVGAQKFEDAGTSYVGAVHIYERNSKGTWKEIQRITASDKTEKNHFGASMSISGDYIVVGAHSAKAKEVNKGAAYIFKKSSKGKWKESQKLISSNGKSDDFFGGSVSISGKYLVVGAEGCDGGNELKNSGAAYIFELNSEGNWKQIKKNTASDAASGDNFGVSVSMSGKNLIVGANLKGRKKMNGDIALDTGASYIFKK